jgi:hypothetical protein
MIKRAGESISGFLEKLERRQKEREAQEKSEWEALSEDKRQVIIAEREQQIREHEAKELAKQHEEQLKKWKRRGITKRYFEAEWDNWIADTPEKEKALRNAKDACPLARESIPWDPGTGPAAKPRGL